MNFRIDYTKILFTQYYISGFSKTKPYHIQEKCSLNIHTVCLISPSYITIIRFSHSSVFLFYSVQKFCRWKMKPYRCPQITHTTWIGRGNGALYIVTFEREMLKLVAIMVRFDIRSVCVLMELWCV